MTLDTMSTNDLRNMLTIHQACVDAGINTGQIQRDKMQRIRLILAKRPA